MIRTFIRSTLYVALNLALVAGLSGCVAYPYPPPRRPPPEVAYIAPIGVAPAPGYVWHYHAHYGWGWWHPHYGWYAGWR